MHLSDDPHSPVYLAIDLGAGSGRVSAGWLGGSDHRIHLEQVHRFRSPPRMIEGHLRWNFSELMEGILRGLSLAAERFGNRIHSLSADTWGVDFGLLDKDGKLLGQPLCYRDERHGEGIDQATARLGSLDPLFSATGIQPMPFNTVFQLLAELDAADSRLGEARQLLFIPDLIHWMLSGVAVNERTIASTSGLLDARGEGWSEEMITALGLPRAIFGKLVDPGTILGPILPGVAAKTGLPPHTRVVAGASHDTASAVVAVPLSAPCDVYLSSGTWSLIGVEHPFPILDAEFAEAGFTNERGAGHKFRLLSNVIGLWILEECRREWEAAGEPVDYGTLLAEAAGAPPFVGRIDATAAEWIPPGHMPKRLRAAIAARGGPAEISRGSLVRTIFEGLAEAYRRQYQRLEKALGKKLSTIHIVGGGCQNRLLNQMTADATDRSVLAGPVEATSLGNIALQMIADGALDSIQQARVVVAGSFPLDRFDPAPSPVSGAHCWIQ